MTTFSPVPTAEMKDEKLRVAQAAINLPEVQSMLKRLGDFNLGIYMPHMHTEEEDFKALPEDMVQVEENLHVSFRIRSQAEQNTDAVPVAWTWQSNGGIVGGDCKTFCFPSTQEPGKHINKHQQGY